MEAQAIIDIYCERLGPGLWAEPINLLTNLAFLIGAGICWWRIGAMAWPVGRGLTLVLALIGLSSGLWHAFATRATAAADSLSILAFVLIFVFATHRDVLGWRPLWSAVAPVVFVLYAGFMGYGVAQLPFFEVSAPYWPIPIALVLYAIALRMTAPDVALGFVIGAAVLCVSLVARTVDESLCTHWPHGTHFLWHLLNATMLSWMIEVLRRHMLATARAQG